MINVRALVIDGPKSAAVQHVDAPVPGPGQLVVDVHRVGICGTDIELFTRSLTTYKEAAGGDLITSETPVELVIATGGAPGSWANDRGSTVRRPGVISQSEFGSMLAQSDVAFLPLLTAADEGHLVNTSSVNGFWASLGPATPHTAYSAAKFAVKGFTEALITDLRINAPHVKCSIVMPGHIGTDIVNNSRIVHGDAGADPAGIRANLARRGVPVDAMDDEALLSLVQSFGDMFRDSAPMSAAEAATVILDGVRAGTWRILVGDDGQHDVTLYGEAVENHPGRVLAVLIRELSATEQVATHGSPVRFSQRVRPGGAAAAGSGVPELRAPDGDGLGEALRAHGIVLR